jgi:hypothetical protein
MASKIDADELRTLWTPERLGQYEGRWIAFKHRREIVASDRLDELMAKFETEITSRDGPIFAYVTFRVIQ